MGTGKKVKFAVCELVQFVGLGMPVLVVMQRFASVLWRVRRVTTPTKDSTTAYWLVVASSVAYVTTVTLLVWVPMKYMIYKKNKFLVGRKKWRPVTLVYVILSTVPSFVFLIASSEVQIRNHMRYDTFPEVPVSLVLFSLICIDIIERIRHCRLTGQARPAEQDVPAHFLTRMEPLAPAAVQREQNGGNRGSAARREANGTVPMGTEPASRGSQSGSHKGPLRMLYSSDKRAQAFSEGFVFWLDTVEMLRVAGRPAVYYSGWAFPVYVLSFLSLLRLILIPSSPLLSCLGVVLQDLPFLVLRIALTATFGFITPLLYLFKNLLVSLAFVYFNFIAKLRMFNTERMF